MIHRNRDAQLVRRGELHAFAGEVGVVDDIVMCQRRGLRQSGRAARKLDINGVVELQLCVETRNRLPGFCPGDNIPVTEKARRLFVGKCDQATKIRQCGRFEFPRVAVRDFRRQFAQHVVIVTGFEFGRKDQRPATDFVQCVLEFTKTIRRIDIHEDQPDPGGRKLGNDPFGTVWRPDSEPFSRIQTER